MVTLTVLTACLLALWVSHRTYEAYVHVVRREERAVTVPHRHIGPTLFLTFDALAVLAILVCLESLGLFETHSGAGPLSRFIQCCTHLSVLVAIWLFLEGRHLQHFYQHLARAGRGLGEARKLAWSDPVLGRSSPLLRKAALAAAIVWAGTPLALYLLGFNVMEGAANRADVLIRFGAWFLAPQVILAALFIRAIMPVRRLVCRATV